MDAGSGALSRTSRGAQLLGASDHRGPFRHPVDIGVDVVGHRLLALSAAGRSDRLLSHAPVHDPARLRTRRAFPAARNKRLGWPHPRGRDADALQLLAADARGASRQCRQSRSSRHGRYDHPDDRGVPCPEPPWAARLPFVPSPCRHVRPDSPPTSSCCTTASPLA